jgi:hypothetical protein
MMRRTGFVVALSVLLGAGSAIADGHGSTSRSHGAPPPTTSTYSAHRGSSHHHVAWRVGGYSGYPGYYGGWGWGWGSGWGWGGWWAGPGWGYTTVYPQPGARLGALDTDVSPERAEIWVDGRRLGLADDFDGFPDYLWLEPGTYDVVIYLPGYKTIARQYSIYAGLVIDVEDRMERGESTPPDQLVPQSHERRDERLRRDRERMEELDRGAGAAEVAPRSDSFDARSEPGRLRLEVTPDDASVYLDGRFLGTGRELAGLRAGLLVDGGDHVLEVVRPGYLSRSVHVEVASGAEKAVEIELEKGTGTEP